MNFKQCLKVALICLFLGNLNSAFGADEPSLGVKGPSLIGYLRTICSLLAHLGHAPCQNPMITARFACTLSLDLIEQHTTSLPGIQWAIKQLWKEIDLQHLSGDWICAHRFLPTTSPSLLPPSAAAAIAAQDDDGGSAAAAPRRTALAPAAGVHSRIFYLKKQIMILDKLLRQASECRLLIVLSKKKLPKGEKISLAIKQPAILHLQQLAVEFFVQLSRNNEKVVQEALEKLKLKVEALLKPLRQESLQFITLNYSLLKIANVLYQAILSISLCQNLLTMILNDLGFATKADEALIEGIKVCEELYNLTQYLAPLMTIKATSQFELIQKNSVKSEQKINEFSRAFFTKNAEIEVLATGLIARATA